MTLLEEVLQAIESERVRHLPTEQQNSGMWMYSMGYQAAIQDIRKDLLIISRKKLREREEKDENH